MKITRYHYVVIPTYHRWTRSYFRDNVDVTRHRTLLGASVQRRISEWDFWRYGVDFHIEKIKDVGKESYLRTSHE